MSIVCQCGRVYSVHISFLCIPYRCVGHCECFVRLSCKHCHHARHIQTLPCVHVTCVCVCVGARRLNPRHTLARTTKVLRRRSDLSSFPLSDRISYTRTHSSLQATTSFAPPASSAMQMTGAGDSNTTLPPSTGSTLPTTHWVGWGCELAGGRDFRSIMTNECKPRTRTQASECPLWQQLHAGH